MSETDVRMWLRGLRMFQLERAALIVWLFWLTAVKSSFLGLTSGGVTCLPADPSRCGPSLARDWVFASIFVTSVLILWAPAGGLVSASVTAWVAARYDALPADHRWWAMFGVLSALVFVQLSLMRWRQARRLAAASSPVPSPPQGSGRELPRRRSGGKGISSSPVWVSSRTGPALAGGFLGAMMLLSWYSYRAADISDHVRHASRVDAVVTARNTDDDWIQVQTADGSVSRQLSVGSAALYRVGERVPLLVDRRGEQWVRLVAEPQDPGLSRAVALGLLALTGAAAASSGRRRWAARRAPSGAGVAVTLRGTAPTLVLAADGGGPVLARIR